MSLCQHASSALSIRMGLHLIMKAAAERLLRLLEEEELEHPGAVERLPDKEQDGETENDRVKSDN